MKLLLVTLVSVFGITCHTPDLDIKQDCSMDIVQDREEGEEEIVTHVQECYNDGNGGLLAELFSNYSITGNYAPLYNSRIITPIIRSAVITLKRNY